MSSDVPVQVVVAAFKDEKAASAALAEMKQAKKEGLIKIVDAAVLSKDANGKLHIKETADMGGGKGAVVGGVIGAVIGVLVGPIGWAAVGGAVIGGLAAKLHDGGFKDERLKKLGEGLGPGNSAIVAVVEHTWVKQVEKELTDAGADAVTEELSADIAQQLQSGGEVAYTALATGDGVVAERVAEHGDFAAGERTSTVDETGPDFAAGERTSTVDETGGDFAAGERTEPKDPNAKPDFAAGEDKAK
jgi:uncharacterized membrane protein